MCEDLNLFEKKEYLKKVLVSELQIIKEYEWLINSCVLDFFVDNHWNKLPNSIKNIVELNPEKLCELLQDNRCFTTVWPLSLLALKIIFEKYTINRIHNKISTCSKNYIYRNLNIRNKFEKGMKLKKRHEIECMSQITHSAALKTGVQFIVDFGAGLGHLARILSYGYGYKVCCLEMQNNLNFNAGILDKNFEEFLQIKFNVNSISSPKHVTVQLKYTTTVDEFKNVIRNAFKLENNEDFSFGIVGLHPCGDLAATLINMFLKCKEAKFLNLVGCCYMKLTQTNIKDNSGYPLSSFLKYEKSYISPLSYESREIACHAIEIYTDRLKSGNYIELKVHAYRATIEQIILRKYPKTKHIGLRNVKNTTNLNFIEYCKNATKNLEIEIEELINMKEVNENLNMWKNIVIFYTLRLLFAPLIESIILYDRALYLIENGCDVYIEAICNPRISPRNHMTTALKKL